ncbi:MAG: DNA polymerase III subunit gamma/tau [Candidatus Pacebacteria bacterium]|nr:DNA polymerase III subunit gamma/tau [Candidatus Paceibacterota bacterium]
MNNNLVLYRKYRPQKFEEVLGQEHITETLKKAVKLSNIAHAYLFAGARGTGKTTVARILARELKCSANDLNEIDAASNRGIDDIRELREAVAVLPFESPVKVYIIDEVHMLTKEAFNALLKTLEEPPRHIIFLLATTEIEKLPDTIISRCQTFTFKKPSQNILKDIVLDISKKEGFELETGAEDLIALLGDSSFRDTLGILQKVVSASSDRKISLKEIEKITGAPGSELVNQFIASLAEKNFEKGLRALNQATENSVDTQVFAKLILHKVRAIMLLRFSKEMEKICADEFAENDFRFLKNLSQTKNSNINSGVLKELIDAHAQTKSAYISQLPLELVLLKFIAARQS